MLIELSIGNHQKDLCSFKSITISFEDIAEIITCCKAYSPIIFNRNKRLALNFKYAQLCILDFDGSITLDDAKETFKDYQAFIVTTKSHQKAFKNDIKIEKKDRYRVIIPFDQPIYDINEYTTVMKNIVNKFNSDSACTDGARFFYPNPYQKLWVSKGRKLFEIKKYLNVSPKKGNTLELMNNEKADKSNNGDNIINLPILAKDGRKMKSKEWVKVLSIKETITVHCPNPSHADIHPSAFITKKNSDVLFIHCHVCGFLGTHLTKNFHKQEIHHEKI